MDVHLSSRLCWFTRNPKLRVIYVLHHRMSVACVLTPHGPPSPQASVLSVYDLEPYHPRELEHLVEAQFDTRLRAAGPEERAQVDPRPAGTEDIEDLLERRDDVPGYAVGGLSGGEAKGIIFSSSSLTILLKLCKR